MRTNLGRRRLAAGIVLLFLMAWSPPRASAEVSSVDGGIKFTYRNANAKSVSWAGAFNNWSATANPMTRDGDVWSVVLPLKSGEQQYKFVVDGQWVADPENPVTGGDFGNSMVKVASDGKLAVMTATSNTAMNPKVYLGGRFITKYISRKVDADSGRLELGRPDFNLDLDFKIRMNDVLDAHMLVNIESENENVQFFRTRLNFDRGSLHLHSEALELFGFDNDSLGTWEDPLHLVGNIGIYHHAFGFAQQGVEALKDFGDFKARALYSDNFRPGGTSRPSALNLTLPIVQLASGPSLTANTSQVYDRTFGDNAKNIFAARVTRDAGKEWWFGVSGRLDRGQNPGLVVIFEPGGTDSAGRRTGGVLTSGNTVERWWAVGADARYKQPTWEFAGEYLKGRNDLMYVGDGSVFQLNFTPPDTSRLVVPLSRKPSSPRLADDSRATLQWSGRLDESLRLSAGVQLHRNHVAALGSDSLLSLADSLVPASDFTNTRMTWSASARKEWLCSSGKRLTASLGLVYDHFDYDAHTPWLHQFWFDRHNFWLDAGEHQVSFDKLTLLGGNNVVSWRPSVAADVWTKGEVKVRWQGTFNGVSMSTRPKYMENLFQATTRLGSRTHALWDVRWAKYDDPLLDLGHGYVDHFIRLSYDFTPGITIQAGWGVDPDVLDPPVNEYAPIGRDLFLFGQGANGSVAQDNYRGLAKAIPAAELALESERRVQLQAIVRF